MRIETLLVNTGDMALKRRAKNIILSLDLKNGDRVLDIGCGDGYYLHLLSNLGMDLKLTGTDIDMSGLKRARKNLGDKIPLIQADLMERLPFENNHFDKAVMSEVVEHLPRDVRGLREVKRVLKKGGILVLTVPNQSYPFFWDPVNWLTEKLFGSHFRSGFFAGIWNNHIRLYKKPEIEKVVKKAGFRIEDSKSLTFWCLPFNHYIVNLTARLLARGLLSTGMSRALSKYTRNPKRPFYLNFAFFIVNWVDKLNDLYQPANSGVGVLVKAVK